MFAAKLRSFLEDDLPAMACALLTFSAAVALLLPCGGLLTLEFGAVQVAWPAPGSEASADSSAGPAYRLAPAAGLRAVISSLMAGVSL